MGLMDDMNKAQSAARSAESAAREQADAQRETLSRVWEDFLAYCRDFATLAPRHGIPSKSGTEVLSRGRDTSRQGRGNEVHRIQHPGGWVMNQHPGATPMFYITTEGALFVEGGGRMTTGLLTSRKIVTYAFQPCPDLPAAAQGTPSLPWKFFFTSSIPRGTLGATRDVARDDLEKRGGCVLLDTPHEESYAKGFVLEKLTQARG